MNSYKRSWMRCRGIGDWNAKVGEQQLGEEGIVGKFGMTGERSDNGERFVSF